MKSLALFGVLLLACAATRADEADYAVYLGDSERGTLTVGGSGDGMRQAVLSYTDRFGLNEITSRFELAAHGGFRELSIAGHDSYGRALEEKYRIKGGRAHWRSETDRGAGPATAFYLPSKSNAEHLAVMARALLRAPEGALDILPRGRARIEAVDEQNLEGAGGEVQARLSFIHGLDVRPTPVWLDERQALFAAGTSRMSYIRKGYEAERTRLLARQEAASLDRARALARTVRRKPEAAVAIRGARLFDPATRTMQQNVTVLIRDDVIEAAGPEAQIAIPPEAEVIEAEGRTVMPGLIDMHVHLGNPEDALLDLLAGVTTVRDMGGDMEELRTLSARFESGELAGPRVIKVGMIDGGSPASAGAQRLASTPGQVRRAIDQYADNGYVQIKLYSSFPPQLVPVAVAAARARGLRVSGHVPAGMTMREAIEAGFDEVHHANFWFLNFMGADVNARTNTPVRFMAVAERGHTLDLDAAEVSSFIDLLRERRVIVDPTLVIFENFFKARAGEPAPSVHAFAQRLPPVLSRRYLRSGLAEDAAAARTYAESYERMSQLFGRLYRAGVTIVPGTDDFFSMGLAHELELYVAAGMPSGEALYRVTLGSAEVLGRAAQIGSVAAGKAADLLLIDGDPIADVGALRNVKLVMRGGTLYDPAALAAAAGLRK